MSLVVPNTADILMLKYIVNYIGTDGLTPPSGGNRVLKLYTNDVTPGKSTVIGDLTQATQTGYAPITLTGTSWTITTNSGINSATYSTQTFTFTQAVTSYGYYITTQANELLWAERFFNGPYTLPPEGGEIAVIPNLIAN
jgi:hypothetical protein